ncbi:MAG: sugar ABC transporter permease [Clostridia bacterium]|nr:sugar ABC transporter permease [Clostridia bacterium]
METVKKLFKKYGNDYFFLSFWLIIFTVFTLVPIGFAVGYSFTNFDMVQTPSFVGLSNYLRMFLDDDIFIKAFMNTMLFAVITGPLGYIMSFVVGWLINDLNRMTRTVLTFLFYSPTLLGSSYMMWLYLFSNDSYGLLNSWLINFGFIKDPVQWLTDPDFNIYVVIVVVLWGSMGAGFLSFVAGFQSLNKSYFEAGAIDGIRNRWQELWYITLPQMGPQLLIGAVLTISGSFAIGSQCIALTGFPSTDYSTHTLLLHIQDYSANRLEMGYASAIAVVLFVIMILSWLIINKAIKTFSHD